MNKKDEVLKPHPQCDEACMFLCQSTPLNDDEISEILDKHGFNEVQIAGEYINIVGLIRDIEKAHGIK